MYVCQKCEQFLVTLNIVGILLLIATDKEFLSIRTDMYEP